MLSVDNPLPPPYFRKIWHYDRADSDSIPRALDLFPWDRELGRLDNDPNLQVELLTDVILNVASNFIPSELRRIKPREPPWLTKNITHYYRIYKKKYKKFVRDGCPEVSRTIIDNLRDNYTKLVDDARQKYLIRQGIKLANPDTDIKTYWSILKTFLNKTKTPSIPPILHNNVFITDFLEKANLFNQYFAHQCTILDTGSFLPHFSQKLILFLILFSSLRMKLMILLSRCIPIRLMAGMIFLSELLNSVDHRYLSPYLSFSKIVSARAFFQTSGKKPMSFQSSKKIRSILLKTIVPFRCFLSLPKFLNALYSRIYITILCQISSLLKTNLDLLRVILLLINYYLSPI